MHLEQWIKKCTEDKSLREIRRKKKKHFLQGLALNKGGKNDHGRDYRWIRGKLEGRIK